MFFAFFTDKDDGKVTYHVDDTLPEMKEWLETNKVDFDDIILVQGKTVTTDMLLEKYHKMVF